jgi:hypothetical protein
MRGDDLRGAAYTKVSHWTRPVLCAACRAKGIVPYPA